MEDLRTRIDDMIINKENGYCLHCKCFDIFSLIFVKRIVAKSAAQNNGYSSLIDVTIIRPHPTSVIPGYHLSFCS